MNYLSRAILYAAGLAAGYGTWGDRAHWWIWIVAATLIFAVGSILNDRAKAK